MSGPKSKTSKRQRGFPGPSSRTGPAFASSPYLPPKVFWSVVLGFPGIVFLIYSNIFHAPFVYDDVSIRDQAYVHVKNLAELVQILFFESTDRRIGYFSFAFNFYLGGLDPFGYHLTNVLIHILNGWLIFWLISRTLGLYAARQGKQVRVAGNPPSQGSEIIAEQGFWERVGWQIAFFTALIWLVHPVQIQAVTYIVQRLVSLCAFFYLLSFACYLLGRLRKGRLRIAFYGLSLLAGLLALGVKQNAATLPFFIFLYDLYFFQGSPWKSLKQRWPYLVGLTIFLVGITLTYLGPSFWETLLARYGGRDYTMGERLLTEARVVIYYLSLIIFPLPSRLNLDYDFPVSHSLLNPASTLISIVLLVILLGYAFGIASKRPLLSFSILWFFGNKKFRLQDSKV